MNFVTYFNCVNFTSKNTILTDTTWQFKLGWVVVVVVVVGAVVVVVVGAVVVVVVVVVDEDEDDDEDEGDDDVGAKVVKARNLGLTMWWFGKET